MATGRGTCERIQGGVARKWWLKQESVGHGSHTEGRTGSGTVSHTMRQRSGWKKKKKPLDVAMATPGWPTPYDVWLSGQMRTKGGIKTGVDLGANGAEDSGEERDGGEGQDGEVPAVTKGVSL